MQPRKDPWGSLHIDLKLKATILTGFLLTIIAELFTGGANAKLAAAETLDAPPLTPAAHHWRMLAIISFLSGAVLLLVASIMFCMKPELLLDEILGWSGIGCIQLSVICGLRYATINRRTHQ